MKLLKFQSPSDAISREWYGCGLYGGLCFVEVALVCVKDVSNLVILLCFIPAKDFIQCLLQIDPKRRYTCKQALAHPWYVELVVSFFVLIISVSYCPKFFKHCLVSFGLVGRIANERFPPFPGVPCFANRFVDL